MNRRLFLTGSIAAGALVASGAAVAGRLSGGDAPPPSFDDQRVGSRWEEAERTNDVAFEEEFGPLTVTATEQTAVLENVALRTEIREKTLDGIDAPLSMAFATRVSLDPSVDRLPAGVGRAELMDEIETAGEQGFRRQLAASGIENVREDGETTITTDAGDEATATEYEGSFEFDDVSFRVTDDASITLEGDELAVTGWLAAWHDGLGPIVAGGVHPGENFARTVEEAITDGILVRLDVDLGLDPASYREEVFELIGSVR